MGGCPLVLLVEAMVMEAGLEVTLGVDSGPTQPQGPGCLQSLTELGEGEMNSPPDTSKSPY